MTREEKIRLLRYQIAHRLITISEVIKECEEHSIELHEEVLEPIGYNTCDRCGDYGDSEQDFLWVDYYPWDEDSEGDRAIIKAIDNEGVDYCALCWGCVNELRKKGAKHEH